jgi:hypothetical protein
MVVLNNIRYLSIAQQKIIFRMFNNGHRINYKEQDVFKNERYFNLAMQILEKAKIIERIDNDYYPEYELLRNGFLLIKNKIIPLIQ